MKQDIDILIIGAGLTGLTLAYYLNKTKYSYKIIEARDRIGGRIHTQKNTNEAPIELGATWFSNPHKEALRLLKELKLTTFDQILGDTAIYEPSSANPPQLVQLPTNQEASYRLKDGTSEIIHALAKQIPEKNILLNQEVTEIKENDDLVTVTTNHKVFKATKVVSTLPPHLLVNTINFNGALDAQLNFIAQQTHTWMGESIKVGFTYETPFWREKNLSGTIFSNVGPVPEMYDHANYEDNLFALKGFMNGNYYKLSKDERCELILSQLEKYYGKQVRNYQHYEETVWKNERYSSTEYDDLVLPHQHNGHAVFQKAYLNNKLFIAGTETSINYSGYMEGAIRSAQNTLEKIK